MKRSETKIPKLSFVEQGDEIYNIIDEDRNIIDTFYNGSCIDHPEDLVIYRMIGDIYNIAYEAGYKKGLNKSETEDE